VVFLFYSSRYLLNLKKISKMDEKISENTGKTENVDVSNEIKGGLFYQNLVKNAKEIKATRAASLTEDVDFAYRTKIETLRRAVRERRRQLEDSLDLYPNTSVDLKLAKDFNAEAFVKKDLELLVEIRNLEIELEIAEKRYKLLLGKSF
jgi:hypothetical protein